MRSNAQFLVVAAVMLILCAATLVRSAKSCTCDICGKPWGFRHRRPYPGADVYLCRHHAAMYDAASRLNRIRFATLRGFWKRVA